MENNERRWVEIQFYFFSKDIYDIKKDLLDIATIIEGIALITPNSKPERLKGLSAKLLSDISARPKQIELIFLMKQNGYSLQEIGKSCNRTKKWAYENLKNKTEPPFHPVLQESDDLLIAEFLETLNKVQKAGINNGIN